MKNKIDKFSGHSIIRWKSRKGLKFDILVDNDIIDKLSYSKYSVYCHWDKKANNYYAVITEYIGKDNTGKVKSRSILLHRFVMNSSDNIIVDHKNKNTMDNRRKNLRETDKSKNCKNRNGANKNNTSGYRNVTWIKGWWRVQLQINGKNHLFTEKFQDVDKAGKFALSMRKKYYKDFSGDE